MLITESEHGLIEKKTGVKVQVEQRDNNLLLMAKDSPCQFYVDGSCSIHDIRPSMCRMYHCGKTSPDAPHLKLVSEIRKLEAENPEYAEYKFKIESKAVEWGNSHGWNWRRREP